jgi:hypothetical protein
MCQSLPEQQNQQNSSDRGSQKEQRRVLA